ncbi:uncharacterized protein LOC129573155, partial [Sitodiplosis mosellana]|uniref:uncharacterized protein LOC129573155 n=1 Tax=Sitodiplosis mosellana TaxID=263140 RepID=UPI0024444893
MSNMLRRVDVMRLLQEAGVQFDPEATMTQLRPLYDDLMAQNMQLRRKQPDESAVMLDNVEERQPQDEQNAQQPVGNESQQQQNVQQQPIQSEPIQNVSAQNVQQQPLQNVQQQPIQNVSVQNVQPQPIQSGPVQNVQQQPIQDVQQQQQIQQIQQQQIVQQNWALQMEREEAELDCQLAIMRKKRELLELQRELQQLETRRIDLKVLEAMMSKFDGSDAQDVSKWIADLENVFEMFKYSERDQLVAARHLMDGSAKRFVQITHVMSYVDLKRALITEYKRAYTVQDVLKQLKARTMKPDETPRQYVIEMQFIASRAEVSEADLIEIIIDGLNDSSTLVSMLYSATTMVEFKVLMERYEKKRNAMMSMKKVLIQPVANKAKALMTVANSGFNASVASANVNAGANGVDMSTIRCYKCFDYGHYQSRCKKPKRPINSCFVCHKVGHTRHDCPDKKKPSEVANAAAVAAAIAESEEHEVKRLAEQLSHTNLVSVAFYEQDKCTELISRIALFDSGSPVSTVKRSYVPFLVNKNHRPSGYRGMGNKTLNEEAAVDLLVGRDLLKKMNIHLCQVKEIKYSIEDLLKLNRNKAQIPNETVVSALELFNLFKSPEKKKTVPQVGKEKMCKSDPEINLINDLMSCEERMEYCVNLIEPEDLNNFDELIMLINTTEADELLSDLIDIDKQLDKREADALRSTIDKSYVKLLDKEKKLTAYSMKIKLTSDAPVYSSPRRLSFKEKAEVQKTIDDLLARGIIRHSESPYASPIVLVRKKNGDLRMCVDYRALNKITVKDHYPLPLIEDCLTYLGGKKYFSTLDLESGFHQVPVEEESIPLTAFVTPTGQYEYCYMPFGLKNAPPVFQKLINRVLKPLIDAGKIVVYLDDINIATETLREHEEILSEVLRLLAEAGLRLNFNKCRFAYREIEYLGYIVNENGMRPNDNHLKAIREYVVPTDAHAVQRCLGLFSYFRRFIYNFSTIAKPLTNLTKKNVKFEWTEECKDAFETLKNKLLEPPVLCIFDPKRETELHTDACTRGYGGMLLQKQKDNKFHPVAYYSKTTTEPESRYHSFELETLAIVNALERFKSLLEGIVFTVVTDCNSLGIERVVNAVASPQSNGQVERVNRTLIGVLSKLTEPMNHANWKNKLVDVEFAINNTVHCTTGQTPSKLLFNVEQRGLAVDELTEYLHDLYSKETENRSEIIAKAEQRIQKSQLYNKKYFEEKHKPAKEFEVGDLVVIKNVDTTVGKNKKLIPKYKGPYVIRKQLGHDRYVVSDVENCQVTQMPYNSVIDSSRMKKWLEPCKNIEELDEEGNTD